MEPLYAPSTGPETPGKDPGLGSAFTVLFAPIKTFLGLATRPRVVLPLLLLVVLTAVTGAVVFSKIDPEDQRTEMRHSFEKRGLAGQELEDSVDRATAVTEKFSFVFPLIGSLFVAVVFAVLAALLLAGLKLAGSSSLTYLQALSVTVHSGMPAVVSMLLSIPIVLGRERIGLIQARSGNILTSNLSFLASEETSNTVRALLGAVDVFSLWGVVLMALGGAVVGRVSRGAAATVAIVLWLLGVLLRVGMASLQG